MKKYDNCWNLIIPLKFSLKETNPNICFKCYGIKKPSFDIFQFVDQTNWPFLFNPKSPLQCCYVNAVSLNDNVIKSSCQKGV